MTTDVPLNEVKINVLKKSQYDSITPNQDEIYLLSDANTNQVFLVKVDSSAPAGVNDGDMYYNTTTKKLYEYDVNDNEWDEYGTPVQEVLYIDKSTSSAYAYTDDGQFIKISSSGAADNVDNLTINLNGNEKLQTIGVVEKNTGSIKYDWVGTKAQYDALEEVNPNWFYYITDDQSPAENNSFNNILNRLNAAYAWTNGNNVRYTVPEPEVNYTAYTSVSNSSSGSTITATTSTTITVGGTTYTRNTSKDSVFVFVPNDTKNQLLSVYDLINAIRG